MLLKHYSDTAVSLLLLGLLLTLIAFSFSFIAAVSGRLLLVDFYANTGLRMLAGGAIAAFICELWKKL